MLVNKTRNIRIDILIFVTNFGCVSMPRISHVGNDEIHPRIINSHIIYMERMGVFEFGAFAGVEAISTMENGWTPYIF